MLTDEQLLALAVQAGAREEGDGQGGAYRELVLSSWLKPTRPDLHLNGLRKFAILVEAEESKACAAADIGGGMSVTHALPRGEVMARGVINGLPVELIRYTEEELRVRDRQWQYEVDRERDTARSERCHRMNLELDLRRLLDGEPTICEFEIVGEIKRRLTRDSGLIQ